MASYEVLIKPSAVKEIEDLPRKDRRRVVERIRALASAPRPTGCVKLSAEERFRVRQASYRIVSSISDPHRTVVVVKVAHRRQVHRGED